MGAGCSLAESITGYELREWKKANPDGIIVSYVNTTAEVKAWTDVCCTSANALQVVESLPKDKKILFVPDKNLGAWIQRKTGRQMELWNGDCCVHERITTAMILEKSHAYPEADVLIHPESNCSHDDAVLNLPQAFLYSTAGMIKHVASSTKKQFIIATEIETIHKLRQDNPDKEFIPIHPRHHMRTNEKSNLGKRADCPGKGTVRSESTRRNQAKSLDSHRKNVANTINPNRKHVNP